MQIQPIISRISRTQLQQLAIIYWSSACQNVAIAIRRGTLIEGSSEMYTSISRAQLGLMFDLLQCSTCAHGGAGCVIPV